MQFRCSDLIKTKFLGHDLSRDRGKYVFETTATDTNLVKNIFGTVQNIILKQILEVAGLL